MDKRTITINPKLLEITSGKRKSEKRKPVAPQKSGTLKKELFKRIKQHKRDKDLKQKELEKKAKNPDAADKEEDQELNDFSSAMKDLTNIVNSRKKTMKKGAASGAAAARGVPPVLLPSTSASPPAQPYAANI